jgi:hypothetical protein
LRSVHKWSGLDYERKYNASASFLAFLLERYGADPLRLIYGASSSRLRDRFGEVYGLGLEQAEAEWQEFLRQP